VPASERHGRGQYFTPNALIDLVLRLAPPRGRVLDPGCGTGRFLLGARERCASAQLAGFDTDPAALAAARAQLPDADLAPADFLTVAGAGAFDLVVGNPPYLRSRGQKRDLYVGFVEQAIEHLRDGGRLAFVLSTAWLDVGYGAAIRTALLDRCAIEWVVESAAERWFPDAKVNTMILVARRCDDVAEREASRVRFAEVRSRLPAEPTVVREIRQDRLPRDEPWGPYLRAPQLWFDVRSRCVPLGELAEVRRGWTTNDNGFFYPPADAGIESGWLRPLAKGPKKLRGVRFGAADLPDRVLVADGPPPTGVRRWIDRRGRTDWTLPPQAPARLFLVKGTHDRHRHPLADVPVHADQQLYLVEPRAGVDVVALAGALNSSWCHLGLELAGRVNFGDGVLWLGLEDARSRLLLPDLRGRDVSALVRAFEALGEGPVLPAGEVGTDPTELDRCVGALIGLRPEETREARTAWQSRCARRLALARSGHARTRP